MNNRKVKLLILIVLTAAVIFIICDPLREGYKLPFDAKRVESDLVRSADLIFQGTVTNMEYKMMDAKTIRK